jgi:hypothetical protein
MIQLLDMYQESVLKLELELWAVQAHRVVSHQGSSHIFYSWLTDESEVVNLKCQL